MRMSKFKKGDKVKQVMWACDPFISDWKVTYACFQFVDLKDSKGNTCTGVHEDFLEKIGGGVSK